MFDLQFHQEMLGNRSVSRIENLGASSFQVHFYKVDAHHASPEKGFSRKMTEFRVEKPPWHQAFGHRLNCFPTFCGMSFFWRRVESPPKKT